MLNVPNVLKKQNKIFIKVPNPFKVLQISKIDEDKKNVDLALINSVYKKKQYKKINKLVYSNNQADN